MAGAPTYRPMVAWVYDTMLWLFSVLVDLFFREVHPRGSWKVPKRGAVILVAAPHANQNVLRLTAFISSSTEQFVDSLILMRVVRRELQRRIAFLIAEKSFRRKFIGILARASGAVPVSRAMDNMKPGRGTIYLPDPINNPTVLRGIGTNFENPEFQVGGTITLPTVNGQAASTDISEIRGPEEIILKKPFRTRDAIYQLTGRHDITTDGRVTGEASHHDNSNFKGSKFKVAPHIDQTKVYRAVFDTLNNGGCIGIFPEGGSHDRPDLLPLKAGVALMALGALAENPECSVKIVPCGMNYFHAHKFRSRAVIEFGNPIEVPPELVQMYRDGHRREAVGSLLSTIYQALVSVTVTSTDYETLMLIQAARRLYNPTGKKLPLPVVVELNRRLVKGYEHYKDDPKIIEVKKSVMEYNKQLWLLGIRDHQVEYAKFSILKVVTTLIYRLIKLAVMTIATLPGLILFAPVFVATKTISIKKSREALAASSVKIQGRDVMATWKLLVALAFAPLLYAFYTAVLTYWTHYNRVQGYVPQWVSLWLVVAFGFIFFPSVTFAALRVGEVGMDIIKSLRPLVLSLNPTSANTLHKLRIRRQELSENVTSLINTFGPELYPDFDATRIVADPFKETFFTDDSPVKPKSEIVEPQMDGENSNADDHLPRNESFHDLANIGFFSTRPPSRDSHSRTSSSGGLVGSAGFPVKALTTLDSKESFAEVTKRIRGAMRERGRRRRKSEDSGWSMASSGSVSPVRMESLKQR
ncbi:Glycerol-3-phosphate/dihydroxyacetone phosphate acyltransferase [Ophidiomyces ophidiicola]|uniref:Glycerol-3-phosphate/dihydroxyacetone phosphate acyltransferase n=1 Tax=Ophidiomyces ophidiicola TaxID=1387563 RepID=A0ACB8V127_9EURO|nr:Glycerol-3-phosphate/dihydroxyacetone phosphate acyltransferase [Ophidiomyces ophidiicola]KAI1931371.1 Glycerol-3-phosphate/dihydroxyacetone phosphate acyltransferase [Ophidiomyces ophidiicola]KAI1960885.1 Glycerol-3-phosphate/dihydroxyacetone phosphate acyltransferase [Ophidiomyces ophidiicola]KAI1974641.1 Glycerol-3-phosphate/dihydroxyacetone phosphate acyltransferase [Ophidiomyces ophidiicola]KAI2031012.1 Glycerol-3-phosphate/dihydroxyacetone phosphate acyltransferase [Ophidiomyces ophidi